MVNASKCGVTVLRIIKYETVPKLMFENECLCENRPNASPTVERNSLE